MRAGCCRGCMMRKYLALLVGLTMAGGGLSWAMLLFNARGFPMWMPIGSIFLIYLGGHLVSVTLREWTERKL
jgi:hypothetical protein